MNRITFSLSVILAAATALNAAQQPAQAGFNWTPPASVSNARLSQPSATNMGEPSGPLTPMPGGIGAAPIEPVSEAALMDNAPTGYEVAPSDAVKTEPGMRSINVLKKTADSNTLAKASSAPTDLTASLPEPGVMAETGEVLTPMPGETPGSTAQNTATSSAQASASKVEGFGRDIPLAIALQQIVPPAYAVRFEPGIDQGKPVSWKGAGQPWSEVLNDMLKSRKLHASLENNIIMVGNGAGAGLILPLETGPSQTAYAPIASDQSLLSGQSVTGGKSVVDLTQKRNWIAAKGASLHDVLQGWSGTARTELAWQAKSDYKLTSGFSFDGSFDEAVDALLSLYGDDAKQPSGTLYPNLPAGPSVLLISSN